MIKQLELKNFTAFDDLKVEFSPKINIIIGKNSTGKTHLLKAAYGLCSAANYPDNVLENNLIMHLTLNFRDLFLPLDDKIGNLHRCGSNEKAYISAIFSQNEKISLSFSNTSENLAIESYFNQGKGTVFIPAKEVLSFMKGFTSLYKKYELSFDQTYYDICMLMDLPEIRPEQLHETSKWTIAKIESICGGRFIFHGGGKVTFKSDTDEYSANSMAEGFRKAGMLARLLKTGSIAPGHTGSLFWDEPDSNLNPNLIKQLVEILLELSRKGQQIILTTHDYVLLKWFDLLSDSAKGDQIRYHSLSKQNGGIHLQSVDSYSQLGDNEILNTFSKLFDEELKRSLGDN